MKNHEKVVFAALLALLVAAAPSCRTAEGGGVLNFSKILSLDWRYESAKDGAQLLVRNLAVRFANDTGAPADGKVRVDWGNGKTEESVISLRATGGYEYTEVVWWETEHGSRYAFQGEHTVTIKLTIQFLETVSPVYEKTVTLKSL
jgi:hypothetical protein